MDTCAKCGGSQWSVADKKYLELVGQCWSCDKKSWEAGTLSLEEFERREKQAVTKTTNQAAHPKSCLCLACIKSDMEEREAVTGTTFTSKDVIDAKEALEGPEVIRMRRCGCGEEAEPGKAECWTCEDGMKSHR